MRTCNYSSGRGATPAIECYIASYGTSVGNAGSWEAMGGIAGGSKIIRGGVGMAWMAWTAATKF